MRTIPTLPCACANLRRAARAVSQLYDEALRLSGIHGPQFTVLQALDLAGEVTQGQLGQLLVMDSTSLTRTLAIVIREGWAAKRAGKDRRERHIRLTAAGRSQLKRAQPYWEKAQAKLRKTLGSASWQDLMRITHRVTEEMTQGEEP